MSEVNMCPRDKIIIIAQVNCILRLQKGFVAAILILLQETSACVTNKRNEGKDELYYSANTMIIFGRIYKLNKNTKLWSPGPFRALVVFHAGTLMHLQHRGKRRMCLRDARRHLASSSCPFLPCKRFFPIL